MSDVDQSGSVSTGRQWAARIMYALAVLFLLFDGTIKIIRHPMAVQGTARLGYPEGSVAVIGLILLSCLVVYVIPRSAVLGAVLLTGYLGGAVATNLRVGAPLVSNTLFPIYLAILVWGPLWLRDARVRALLPLRR